MAAPVSAAAPPLAFRVGITGTRDIPAAAQAQVRSAVAAVLGAIRATIERLAASPALGGVYAAPHGRIVPLLRIVSPLAEGSDRLAAEEALKLGYALDATLPFEQDEYERDFPRSVDAFRTLLSHAGGRVLALDGARGVHEWHSYEAIGRHVVRNCDLVLAIWDPDVPAKGRGGTEDTIHFAVETALPVWWIDASGRHPDALIEHSAHLYDLESAPTGAAALSRLEAGIGDRLIAPLPEPAGGRAILDRLVVTLRRWARLEPDPLRAFLNERERRRSRLRLFDRLMHFLARGAPFRAPETALAAAEALRTEDGYWSDISRRARRLASRWADLYRTSRLLVVASIALAVVAAVLALALSASGAGDDGGGLAIASLAGATAVAAIIAERAGRWHERWKGYRLLAELARAQQAIAWIGWGLPRGGPGRRTTRAERRDAWIDWYIDAAMRAAPLRAGWLGGSRLDAVRRGTERILVAGQAVHHFNRRSASEEASRKLANAGHACVFAAGLCLVAGLFAGAGPLPCIVAIVLAALGVAMLALRASVALDAMAAESERMEAIVERIEACVRGTDPTRPLASQDLGGELRRRLVQMLRGSADQG